MIGFLLFVIACAVAPRFMGTLCLLILLLFFAGVILA